MPIRHFCYSTFFPITVLPSQTHAIPAMFLSFLALFWPNCFDYEELRLGTDRTEWRRPGARCPTQTACWSPPVSAAAAWRRRSSYTSHQITSETSSQSSRRKTSSRWRAEASVRWGRKTQLWLHIMECATSTWAGCDFDSRRPVCWKCWAGWGGGQPGQCGAAAGRPGLHLPHQLRLPAAPPQTQRPRPGTPPTCPPIPGCHCPFKLIQTAINGHYDAQPCYLINKIYSGILIMAHRYFKDQS